MEIQTHYYIAVLMVSLLSAVLSCASVICSDCDAEARAHGLMMAAQLVLALITLHLMGIV